MGDDVKVVVDLDTSRPRKNYLPDHSPDAGSWKGRGVYVAPKAEEKPVPSQPSGLALVEHESVRDVAQVCACGCDRKIPRDPGIRFVVDFGAPRPYPAYLREHSPDYPGRRNAERKAHPGDTCPGFVPASMLLESTKELGETGSSSAAESFVPRDPAHSDGETAPSPQAGRAWASGQLVFNAGQFESARSGFADYTRDGETGQQLRTRVNRVILEDLEQKVIALRALHEKLRDRIASPSFGDLVARSKPV